MCSVVVLTCSCTNDNFMPQSVSVLLGLGGLSFPPLQSEGIVLGGHLSGMALFPDLDWKDVSNLKK